MRVMSEALVFQKEFRKGKKGNQKGGSKGKKGSGRSKVPYGQCSNCMEFGHWSRDCPNMSVNNVAQKDSGNKNLFLQANLLPLRNPQQQCGESFSLVVHLPILHLQLLLPLHVCLRRPWFYFMIRLRLDRSEW